MYPNNILVICSFCFTFWPSYIDSIKANYLGILKIRKKHAVFIISQHFTCMKIYSCFYILESRCLAKGSLVLNSFKSIALHNLTVCNLVKDRSWKVFSLITMTTACNHTGYRCHDYPELSMGDLLLLHSLSVSAVFLSHSAYSVPSDAAVGSCVWKNGEKLWLSFLSMV